MTVELKLMKNYNFQGDSGGPLVCKDVQKGMVQYGVVSFVKVCGSGVPDAYVNVYHERDFIKQEMEN